ncbi:MAG: protein kinase domain-containing protein, partial [Blastocatellia bacterium]
MTPEHWKQIARLFDEALELEPDRRADFLAEACAGDDALRREVETLLAARDDAGGFLSRDAIELEAAWLAAERTAIPSGQMIGHFEALEPLGAGAMGEVYLARDTRLERQVALKLLPARFTQDAQRLRRFEREARAASALNHPNIITVYETGVDGAYHFIAAEFVAGVTLRQRLAEGPLPLAEAIAVAAQIAAALDAAHAAGITHRDIKPENVMLRPDGVVKVLDFGIAKLAQSSVPGQDAPNHSTEQGTVIGTPGYMSPEQARGLDVDARTDIFSLGVALYEMIAGHAPFRGATHADVIVALLEREPEPLSANSPESPVELDEIIAKALAKDVTRRYQTAGELLTDLQAVKSRQGETLRAQAAQSRIRAWPLRARWTGLVLAAVAMVGLILAGNLAWRYYQRIQEASDWSGSSRLRVTTPYSTRMGLGGQLSPPSFAPDGKRVVFSRGADGQSHIIVKELDSGAELKLTDEPVRDYDPIWSPDGVRLAFISLRPGRSEIRTLPYQPPTDGAQTLLKP